MLGPTQQSLALAPNAVDVALKVMQVPNRCAGFEESYPTQWQLASAGDWVASLWSLVF